MQDDRRALGAAGETRAAKLLARRGYRIVERNVSFLWTTFIRFEPAADVYAAETQIRRHHSCYTAPIVFDCRLKPGFPDELVSDEEVSACVTRRWKEYFPDGDVEGVEDNMGYMGFDRMK